MADSNAAHIAHPNVTVLTTDDATTLDTLLARAEVRSLVWMRLDPTHALVDTEHVQTLARRLRELGHAPRFSSVVP